MKVYLDWNELYPVYTLDTNSFYKNNEVEVTEEFYEEYKIVSSAFRKLQKELEKIYDNNIQ
jgi:hypothetical protein